MTKKRLYKSEDKVFAGVIGGVAEYYDLDPTVLRLIYVLLAVVTGFVPAIVGYIIAVLVVPNKPTIHHMDHTEPPVNNTEAKTEPEKTA
jgi:phage shock protein PspC (stress-responsive transcriptional regulator)